MRIRALGTMLVGAGDTSLRDRAVLGVLLVRSGSRASMDEVAEAIWGDRPPTTHRKVVQGAIVRLRKELGEEAISTVDGGYRLDLATDEIDVDRFERLIDAAESALAEGEARAALRDARAALDLWRGDPYQELPGWPPAEAEAQRLTERRMSAEDVEIESLLLSGRCDPAVARAQSLISSTPYREGRWALLARAQYASGRQADALETIRTLRTTLQDDLGVDPSREIVSLESAMLRQDPSLDLPSAVASGRWLFSRTGKVVAAARVFATLLGAGVALDQRRRAGDAAARATAAQATSEALRLGELASTQTSPTLALALAAQALALDDSTAVRARALTTYGNFAHLISTGRPPPGGWPAESTVAVSPDGSMRATARNASIELVVAGRTTRRLITPGDHPTALTFSPDGQYLAAGMSQLGFPTTGATVVWNTTSGTQVAAFDSGDGAVRAHVFSADDTSIWSFGDDGIHQWDLTGSQSLVRTAHGEPVAFVSDSVVLSIGDDSVRPWIAYACRLAGRPLTTEEWRGVVGDRPYAPTC
jgi:DNA-binding SARP family transcriptional activator